MRVKSPIDELGEEHESLRAHARDIQEAVRGLGAGTGAAWADVGRNLEESVRMFRRSLLLHFRREEEGLFPEARRLLAERAKRADVMSRFFAEEGEDDMSAHTSLASRTDDTLALLRQIEEAGMLDEESLRRLRTLVNTTISLLERHAEKEKRLIFPMIERSLDPLDVEEVRKRMSGLTSAQLLVEATDEDVRRLDIEAG
jgi:hemerythrin-like domain-containing protein